jgi:hypothetical protein
VDDKITESRYVLGWPEEKYGKIQSGIQSEAENLEDVILILERWNIVLGRRSLVVGK